MNRKRTPLTQAQTRSIKPISTVKRYLKLNIPCTPNKTLTVGQPNARTIFLMKKNAKKTQLSQIGLNLISQIVG